MSRDIINNYISERYNQWLDYSKYHCSHQSMNDQAIDVLNEVIIMLIEKFESNPSYIMQLHDSKKGKYRELDFFILQMIKLNIQSPTSPYQYKYRYIAIDENVDYQLLEILDEEDIVRDRAEIIFNEMQQVRHIVDNSQLSESAKHIFYWKFFEGNRFSEWKGSEDKSYLYDVYNDILTMVKNKINGNVLF